MAKISHIVEGLRLLAKYEQYGEETHIEGAGEDIIYGTDKPPMAMTDTDRFILKALGWEWNEQIWLHYV